MSRVGSGECPNCGSRSLWSCVGRGRPSGCHNCGSDLTDHDDTEQWGGF
ncbi:hypothetical protein [Natronorarus salvus]